MTQNLSSEKRVLCAARNSLPDHWLKERVSLPIKWESFLQCLCPAPMIWLDRAPAEMDEAHKQWIPYALLMNEEDQIAAYPRQGGEERLHGSWSIGIGGHVHPADGSDWESAMLGGLKREVSEEYEGVTVGEPVFLGIINEELTEVGKVHMGAVFLQRCLSTEISQRGELSGMEWMEPIQIGNTVTRSRFEKWSLLALELLMGFEKG